MVCRAGREAQPALEGNAMAKKQSGWRSEVSRETARLRDEGRELREAVPREAHAGWAPRGDRRDPVEILEQQAATRIAELVPVRYGRMAVSPFAFFRGAAAIMPRIWRGRRRQACASSRAATRTS